MNIESAVLERYSECLQGRVEPPCCPIDYDKELLKIIPGKSLTGIMAVVPHPARCRLVMWPSIWAAAAASPDLVKFPLPGVFRDNS